MAAHPFATASEVSLSKASTPVPGQRDADTGYFNAPTLPFLASDRASSTGLRESALGDSTTALGGIASKNESTTFKDQGETVTPVQPNRRRRWLLILAALLGLIVVVLAVILPVYFTVIKKKDGRDAGASDGLGAEQSDSQTSAGPTSTGSAEPAFATSGGDGSTVTTEEGTTFTYNNAFGGTWHWDPEDPYNDSAQPNSWTPPLSENFDYETTRIYGVNLGGLFVLEPFISPALFQKYPGTVDEWTLSEAMAADTSPGGGLEQLEEHYRTFITEEDIAQIAGAGLNWIRLPVPFWAIETYPGEPFLPKTSWRYIVRVLEWCRKYGIRVNLDLHSVPGSANAYNHGGRMGVSNFMRGGMGMANAQRTLYYIQVFTEFINQPEWRKIVPMFSIMNEPIIGPIGSGQLRAFYVEAHRMIHEITGYGEGNGPYMVIHDSFSMATPWIGFMTGADRVAMDIHPYFVFGGDADPPTIDTGTGPGAGGTWPARACERFTGMMSDSRTGFGVSMAGEFSSAWNDCSLFLTGVTGSPSFGGDCSPWRDSSTWSDSIKEGLLAFTSAQMDSLGDWFFWTWRIGESTAGIVESPFWSYKLGLEGGWIPTDPRTVAGTCASIGLSEPWSGTFQGYMIGGDGAGPPSDASSYPWPPAALGDGNLPQPTYAMSGAPIILEGLTHTDSNGDPIPTGAQAGFPAPTAAVGCLYTDPWGSEDMAGVACTA